MILIDIYMPSLDRSYDFQVDETVPVGSLITEIAEMVGNETKSQTALSTEKFMLCSMEQGSILRKDSTLKACGVKNGSRLMLV